MGEFQEYAGDSAAVQRIARNIVIGGGGRLENVNGVDAICFIHDADEIVNATLGSVYITPLRQITRGGETFYPQPIANISRRIAASYMVAAIYTEIDKNVSAAAERLGQQAIRDLEELSYGILRGDSHLEGQIMLAKNNFANPRVVPRENFPSPRVNL